MAKLIQPITWMNIEHQEVTNDTQLFQDRSS